MAASTLSVRPNRPAAGLTLARPPFRRCGSTFPCRTTSWLPAAHLLERFSCRFRRARRRRRRCRSRTRLSFLEFILATCNDHKAVDQVEAAYDMLLMQRLTQHRAGKVENGHIRYADVKPKNSPGVGSTSQ